MKPDLGPTLGMMAEELLMGIVPHIGLEYARSSAQVFAALLLAASEEWDRAAARRVEENRALRELFRQAAPRVADPRLRERLETAAAEREPSLRIRDLDAANARLKALLIELHEHVEEQTAPEAREIERAIWAELRAATKRRTLSFWPL